MKPFWVSFYDTSDHLAEFEYEGPWWSTGFAWDRDDNELQTICLAVMAETEEAAQQAVVNAYDNKDGPPRWRFTEEQDPDWDPKDLGDRFPVANWMRWPHVGEK